MKKIFLACVGLAALVGAPLIAQQNRAASDELEILPVHGSIYMIAGAGGNVTVSAGKDGVLLVDSGTAENADKVLAAVQRLQRQLQVKEPPVDLRWGAETRGTLQNSLNPYAPTKPIRYIINAHAHPDHTGGNLRLAKSGRTFTGGNVSGDIADAGQGAAILAYENVLNRMSAPTGSTAPAPEGAWPTDTFHQDSMKLSHFFNGDGVQIIHIADGHTDGDSLVYFRGSDVISAGRRLIGTGSIINPKTHLCRLLASRNSARHHFESSQAGETRNSTASQRSAAAFSACCQRTPGTSPRSGSMSRNTSF